MDFTDTALIRIGARQLDRQFKLAPFECAINAIGVALLLFAGWVFEVSPTAQLLSVVPLIIAITRWIISILYRHALQPRSAIARWTVYFNFGAVINALSWGLAAAYVSVNESAGAAVHAAVVIVIACRPVCRRNPNNNRFCSTFISTGCCCRCHRLGLNRHISLR
jgi:uncharacterized membrane protein